MTSKGIKHRTLDRLQRLAPAARMSTARLPGFRNILVHEYVGIDYDIVVRALDRLEPVEEFLSVVADRLRD